MKNLFKNTVFLKKVCGNYIFRDTVCFMFFAVFFAVSCLLLSGNQSFTVTPEVTDTQPVTTGIQTPEPPYITDTRTLSEYHGYLAAYDCFGVLITPYDIKVSSLPAADRELVAEGIIFENENALCDFIESLES